jgi:hypothetical protein
MGSQTAPFGSCTPRLSHATQCVQLWRAAGGGKLYPPGHLCVHVSQTCVRWFKTRPNSQPARQGSPCAFVHMRPAPGGPAPAPQSAQSSSAVAWQRRTSLFPAHPEHERQYALFSGVPATRNSPAPHTGFQCGWQRAPRRLCVRKNPG